MQLTQIRIFIFPISSNKSEIILLVLFDFILYLFDFQWQIKNEG